MSLYLISYIFYLYFKFEINPYNTHFCYHIIKWPSLASLTISYFKYFVYKIFSVFIMFTIIITFNLIIIYLIAIDTSFKITILLLYHDKEIKSNSLKLKFLSYTSTAYVIFIIISVHALINLKITKIFYLRTCNDYTILIVRQNRLIVTQYRKKLQKIMMTTNNNNILFNNCLTEQFENDKIHTKKLNHILQKHDKSFNLMHMNIRIIKKHITE